MIFSSFHNKRRSRPNISWAGVPLLLAIGIQGMPLGRELKPAESLWAENIHAITVEKVTQAGTKESIIPALFWGALYIASIYGIFRSGFGARAAKLYRRQWPLCLLLLLVPLSALWSPNLAKISVNLLHGSGVFAITVLAAMHYAEKPVEFFRATSIILNINLALHLLSVLLLPGLTIAYDNRWMGLSGQANVLGSIGLCTVWCSLSLLVLERSIRIWRAWAGLILSIVILYGANSVTSIITSLISLFLILIFFFGRKLFNRHNISLIILMLLFFLGIGLLILFAFDSILNSVTAFGNRSEDFSGRTVIWQAAVDLIELEPIFGWGYDDNARVIIETGMPHTNYHNGYLDLAVRGGVFSVILLVVSITLFFRHLSRLKNVAFYFVSVAFVVPLLVYNLTEVTFFAPRNILWIIFLWIVFIVARNRFLAKRSS